jgi:hypothetical protein
MRPRRSLAGVLFIPILLVLLTAPSSTAPSAEGVAEGVAKSVGESAAEDEAKESFTFAVVRRDSIAIPFATYDGKRWKNSWPKPESRVTAPIVLADVPKRWWTGRDPILKWTLWPIDPSDTASRPLETIGPTWFPAHCHQSLGLRTTYSTREVLPPLNIQPYPKAGLAVAGIADISPIEVVDVASSKLVDALARTLVKSVLAEERRIINDYVRGAEGWRHPYNDAERMETPLRIDAMYKVARGLGDRDVYYYEAIKHYAVREPASKSSKSSRKTDGSQASGASASGSSQTPGSSQTSGNSQNLQSAASTPSSQLLPSAQPATAGAATPAATGKGPGQEPCDLVTFVSGWLIGREDELLKDKERISPLQVNVNVTSCDFASAYIMLPLGAVRVKDKTLWAVQGSGWTHEHYAVIDVKDDLVATVLATDGGYCPKR